jgi:hypothetical protein
MANASTAALVRFPVNIDIDRNHYPSAQIAGGESRNAPHHSRAVAWY